MDDLSDLIPRFDLRGMDLQLDRMDAALRELDHPCRTIPAIQVLGTNGRDPSSAFWNQPSVPPASAAGSPPPLTW